MHSYIFCPVKNDLNPTICTNSFRLVSARFEREDHSFQQHNMQVDFTLNASSPCTWPIILLIIIFFNKSFTSTTLNLPKPKDSLVHSVRFIFLPCLNIWTHFILMFITCVVTHSNHSREYLCCISKQWYAHCIDRSSIFIFFTVFTNETNERTQQNHIVNDDDGKEHEEVSTSS